MGTSSCLLVFKTPSSRLLVTFQIIQNLLNVLFPYFYYFLQRHSLLLIPRNVLSSLFDYIDLVSVQYSFLLLSTTIDRIGLLRPIRSDENGYRVYASHQMDVVSTIKLFQEMGLSLKEIAEVFQLQDITLKSQLLREQKQNVMKRINELQKISAGIDFMAERFEQFQNKGGEVFFEEELIEEEHYRLISKSSGSGQGKSISVNYLNYGYQCGVLFERENLLKENEKPSYDYLFYKVAPGESNYVKPKGRYLSIFYLLRNEEVMRTVPDFIHAIDFSETVGPLYHEDFCNEIAGFPEKFIIKLSIQLTDNHKKY